MPVVGGFSASQVGYFRAKRGKWGIILSISVHERRNRLSVLSAPTSSPFSPFIYLPYIESNKYNNLAWLGYGERSGDFGGDGESPSTGI